MGLMDVLYDLLLNFVERYDARRGIPRPVTETFGYLTPGQQEKLLKAMAPFICSRSILCGVRRKSQLLIRFNVLNGVLRTALHKHEYGLAE